MSQQSNLFHLLKRPILTEKATSLAAFGQYVFEVNRDANKIELTKAFELAFPGRKVKKVRLINLPGKTRRRGKAVGKTQERCKAIFSIEGDAPDVFQQA